MTALDYHLRQYAPGELGPDGYPRVWHANVAEGWAGPTPPRDPRDADLPPTGPLDAVIHRAVDDQAYGVDFTSGVKHLARAYAGHACERCRHPFLVGDTPGEWSPCEGCDHDGPVRERGSRQEFGSCAEARRARGPQVRLEAQWRVLTVHHLNGVKSDLRWWNLAVLCQRCHLQVQGRVVMERAFIFEHSAWFRPHAAGWYAVKYLGEELPRGEALRRLDELLSLERLA